MDSAVLRQGAVELDFPYASLSVLSTPADDRVFYALYEGKDLLSGYKGFTTEPAAIVLNTVAFDQLPVPATRQDLIEVLRTNADTFIGKVGTYDVRQSGLGYLFATQDARVSEPFWRYAAWACAKACVASSTRPFGR